MSEGLIADRVKGGQPIMTPLDRLAATSKENENLKGTKRNSLFRDITPVTMLKTPTGGAMTSASRSGEGIRGEETLGEGSLGGNLGKGGGDSDS